MGPCRAATRITERVISSASTQRPGLRFRNAGAASLDSKKRKSPTSGDLIVGVLKFLALALLERSYRQPQDRPKPLVMLGWDAALADTRCSYSKYSYSGNEPCKRLVRLLQQLPPQPSLCTELQSQGPLLKNRERSPDMSRGRFIVLVASVITFAATVAVGYILAP
jgi:hypothetical protein